jgi:hypothetical protein
MVLFCLGKCSVVMMHGQCHGSCALARVQMDRFPDTTCLVDSSRDLLPPSVERQCDLLLRLWYSFKCSSTAHGTEAGQHCQRSASGQAVFCLVVNTPLSEWRVFLHPLPLFTLLFPRHAATRMSCSVVVWLSPLLLLLPVTVWPG